MDVFVNQLGHQLGLSEPNRAASNLAERQRRPAFRSLQMATTCSFFVQIFGACFQAGRMRGRG